MNPAAYPSVAPPSYDDCVKAVYRAGAGSVPWGAALDSVTRLFGGWNSHAMGVNPNNGVMQFSHEGGGPPPQGTLEYISKWHKFDPRAAQAMATPPGQWIHCHELFDDEYVANSPFYRDFLIPYGMRYVSGVRYVVSPDLWVVFSVSRGVGREPLNLAERETLRRLGEHLEVALSLQTTAKVAMQAAFAGYVVLRKLHYAVMVMTEDRTVLFSNDAAERLLAEGSILVTNGRLVLRDKSENAELTVGMKQAQLNQALKQVPQEAGRPASLVRCGRSLRNEAALMHLSVIEPAESMGAFGSATTIVVTFFVGGEGARLDPFVVGYAYNLTPAESRVAVGVAEGLTVDAIAEKNGTSVATVRTQLKSACAKIGVARQAELAQLLSSNAVFRLTGAV